MALIHNAKGAGIGLDAKTGRATQTARTVYLALLTAAPTATDTLATMTELTTSGYARQTVTFTVPAGSPVTTSNVAAVTFGPFTADPPNVTHAALVSVSSGTVGDLIDAWSLNSARDGGIGDSLQGAAGQFTLAEA